MLRTASTISAAIAYLQALIKELENLKIFASRQSKLIIIVEQCDNLIMIAHKLMSDPQKISDRNIQTIISHLSAISHYLKLASGTSVFAKSLRPSLERCIEHGYAQFIAGHEVIPKTVSASTNISVLPPLPIEGEELTKVNDRDYQKEKNLIAEQKYLRSLENGRMTHFMHEIWKYALNDISGLVPTKKIFISYGWPRGNSDSEKWTQIFIQRLVTDLNCAGIQVYLDQNESGPGNNLRDFMKIIQHSDRVLVISSATWLYKVNLTVSGVRYEYDQITEYLTKHPEINSSQFISVLCLNKHNYCENHYRKAEVISFYQSNYLDTLKSLITHLYGFNPEQFAHFWQEKMTTHKIVSNFWRLPKNNYFIGRQSHLEKLAGCLNSSQTSMPVILWGPEGSGKTAIVLQFIYNQGHQYEGVCWFDAQDRSNLLQSYREFAEEKAIVPGGSIHALSETEIMTAVKQWLAKRPAYLLIYDNANEKTLIEFFPVQTCSIIITTTNPAIFNSIPVYFLAVNQFTEAEAAFYVLKIIGKDRFISNVEDIGELLTTVGRLPLQLKHACGFIQRNKLTIEAFLHYYRHSPDLLEQFQLFPERVTDFTTTPTIAAASSLTLSNAEVTISIKDANLRLLKQHFAQLEIQIGEIATSSHLTTITTILRTIKQNLQMIKSNDTVINLVLLKVTISHLQTVLHYLHFTIDADVASTIAVITQLVKESEKILSALPSHLIYKQSPFISSRTNTTRDQRPCIDNSQTDNPAEELIRFAEQKKFHNKPDSRNVAVNACKLVLQKVWAYAIDWRRNFGGHFSKKIYISFAWPDINDPEEETWTVTFMRNLVQHLTQAGLQVYLPGIYPSERKSFNELIMQGHTFDHVLIISSRTRARLLKTIAPNVLKQEQTAIMQYADAHPELKANRFIIPVLLNNINHCGNETIKSIAELSFFKTTYLEALSTLIATIYGFDLIANKKAFNNYWQRQLIKHGLKENTWHVPITERNLINRPYLLQQIKTCFSQIGNQHLILTACYGIGGVGKTTIAKQFIDKYAYVFSKIYWFDASTVESLLNGYISLGEEKNIFVENEKSWSSVQRAKRIKHWLENQAQTGWLIILDNVSNYLAIKNLLPIKGGKILITSRHTEWPEYSIEVSVFTREEAQQYVAQSTKSTEVAAIDNLIEKLGYLPLALSYACAYINRQHISVAKYLKRYDKQLAQRRLLLADSSVPRDNQHESVEITWKITMLAMQKESPLAVPLLRSCAYLHAQRIPQIFFFHYAHFLSGAPRIIGDTQSRKIEAINALRVCREYSMLMLNETEMTLSLHNVLQTVMQHSLAIENLEFPAIKTALESSLGYLKDLFDSKKHAAMEQFILHLKQLWQFAEQYKAKLTREERILYICFLMALFEISAYFSKYEKYKVYFEQALQLSEIDQHEPAVQAIKILAATVYIAFDDLKHREMNIAQFAVHNIDFDLLANQVINATGSPWLEDLLRLFEKILGQEHVWSSWIGSFICAIYVVQLNVEEAPKYQFYLTQLKEKKLDAAHRLIKICETFLANPTLVRDMLRYNLVDFNIQKELSALLKDVFGKIQNFLTGNNPSEIFQNIKTILVEIWGENHIHVAHLYMQFAHYQIQRGEYNQAIELLTKALPILRNFLSATHRQVIKVLINLATCHLHINQKDIAIDLLNEAEKLLSQREAGISPNHATQHLRQQITELKKSLGLPIEEIVNNSSNIPSLAAAAAAIGQFRQAPPATTTPSATATCILSTEEPVYRFSEFLSR